MDFFKKVKLTLLFTFGLFLFWFNTVYAVELDCTSTFQMGGAYSRYLYMDDIIMDYISTVSEYSGIGSIYNMFGTLNTSNSQFEFYFTPYSDGTPSQLNLNTNKLLFTGTYNYIKYSCSSINFDPNNVNWSRSTGTHTGNTSWTIYTRTSGNNFYYYYWGSTYATWFNNTNWNGFPVIPVYSSFINPTIDGLSPDTYNVTSPTSNVGFKIYPNSVGFNNVLWFYIYDLTYDINNDTPDFVVALDNSSNFYNADNDCYYILYRITNSYNLVNGNKYRLKLGFYNSANATTLTYIDYYINFNFDSATVENIQENTQQDIKNQLEQTQDFLSNSDVDVGSISNIIQDYDIRITNPNTRLFKRFI